MEEFKTTTNNSKDDYIYNSRNIQIEQNNIKYDLNIGTKKDKITFSLNDKEQFPSVNYNRTISIKEIKGLNKAFSLLNSLSDFYEYLQSLAESKKISIKKYDDKLLIILFIEVLAKQQTIEIDLSPTKKDLDTTIKEIYQELLILKTRISEIDDLKKDNEELKNKKKLLKEKIENQDKEINDLKNTVFDFMNRSVIMKEDEKSLIFTEIENKMNMKIKKLKKLYQATIDGGDPINFHKKCDNIPNTLVLIKSEGQRRFGGFTPIPWKSEGNYVKDPELKTFIFSFDNKEIYPLNNVDNAVYHSQYSGPIFGYGPDIGIKDNPINENSLYTHKYTYNYKDSIFHLSDHEGRCRVKAKEYEVFQVIFN